MTKLISFLDADTIPDVAEWPAPAFPHRWRRHPATAPEQRVEHIGDASIVLTNKVVIDRGILETCPQLELVAVTATGVNNVDLEACRAAGVHVCNVKDYAGRAVAEWCVGQLFNLCWNQSAYRREQANGEWPGSAHFNHPVARIRETGGLHVGILGRGDIGRRVQSLLGAFGARVDFLERPGARETRAGYRPFRAGLAEVDALILCCPLTDASRGLIDAETLSGMKHGAFLINPARGALLNEADVAAAVIDGTLGGLAVDVLGEEPPRSDNPLYRLHESPNVIITPHIAWCSRESVTTLINRTVDNLNRFAAGDTDFCLV